MLLQLLFVILQVISSFNRQELPSEETKRHAEEWVNAMKSQMDYYPQKNVPSMSWENYIQGASGQIRHYDDYDYLYDVANQREVASIFNKLKDGTEPIDKDRWDHFWKYLLCQLKGYDCNTYPTPTGDMDAGIIVVIIGIVMYTIYLFIRKKKE